MLERAHERVAEILQDHRSSPLDDKLLAEVSKIAVG
jgi:hypothetical protein